MGICNKKINANQNLKLCQIPRLSPQNMKPSSDYHFVIFLNSGNYGPEVSQETLKIFNRRRVQVLASAGSDLIAFETIPSKLEAEAYRELLEEECLEIPSWVAFSSEDGIDVVSGDSIQACAAVAESSRHVVGVGINCTPHRFIHGLVTSIKKVTDKPVLVYPNIGETCNAEVKRWVKPSGATNEADFISDVCEWREAWATLIGGCCRTTSNTIRAISTALYNESINTIIPQLQYNIIYLITAEKPVNACTVLPNA